MGQLTYEGIFLFQLVAFKEKKANVIIFPSICNSEYEMSYPWINTQKMQGIGFLRRIP